MLARFWIQPKQNTVPSQRALDALRAVQSMSALYGEPAGTYAGRNPTPDGGEPAVKPWRDDEVQYAIPQAAIPPRQTRAELTPSPW